MINLKESQMKLDKCSYASKYRAIYRPTCGCNFCADMWTKANTEEAE